MTRPRLELLRNALEVLEPLRLEIEDEGHLHAGHAGAKKGGHYRIRVVSHQFDGKSPIARHRMVYSAVEALMQTEVHALSISAHTPQETAAKERC